MLFRRRHKRLNALAQRTRICILYMQYLDRLLLNLIEQSAEHIKCVNNTRFERTYLIYVSYNITLLDKQLISIESSRAVLVSFAAERKHVCKLLRKSDAFFLFFAVLFRVYNFSHRAEPRHVQERKRKSPNKQTKLLILYAF